MFEPTRLSNDRLEKTLHRLVVEWPPVTGNDMRQDFLFARRDVYWKALRMLEARYRNDQFGAPIQQRQ